MSKKKIAIGVFALFFLIPQVTLAAWWNPMTWKKPKPVAQPQVVETASTTEVKQNVEVQAPPVSAAQVPTTTPIIVQTPTATPEVKKEETNSVAPSPSCIILTKDLYVGLEDKTPTSEILKLQKFLYEKKYLTNTPNGYYGAGTVAAVKKFQTENGIVADGTVKSGMRAKVKEKSCNDSKSQPSLGTTSPRVSSVKKVSEKINTSATENSTAKIGQEAATKNDRIIKEGELFPTIIDGNILEAPPVTTSSCYSGACYEIKTARYLAVDKKTYYEITISKLVKNENTKSSNKYFAKDISHQCFLFSKYEKITLTQGEAPLKSPHCLYSWKSIDNYSMGIKRDFGEPEEKKPTGNFMEMDKKSGPLKYYISLFPLLKE